jgi:hypothetical protein
MAWRCADLLKHAKNQVCFTVDSARNDDYTELCSPRKKLLGWNLVERVREASVNYWHRIMCLDVENPPKLRILSMAEG